MYVLYTHRACWCGCETVCLLACETVATVCASCCRGSQAQRCTGACWEFLPWHIWWICLQCCPRYRSCARIVCRCVPIAVWKGTSSQCVLLSLTILFLLQCSFRLLSPCGFEFVICLSVLSPLGNCGCVVLLVLPVPIEYNSDSALDSATIACVLDPKWIVAPRYLIANPVVDFLVVVQPAQSA